jgi:hypothetical protein
LVITSGLLGQVLYGQQPAVKRHPGDHLRYTVTLADGDTGKVTGVSVHLKTPAAPRPDQQGRPQIDSGCQKSANPKVWACDVVIPPNAIDGDYELFEVDLGTPDFSKSYSQDFHVRVVPIQNPSTFTPPSKITVSE